jgi:hypothetical protein
VTAAPPVLVLLGTPDCHLCHEMHDAVLPLLRARGLGLVERDVRDDPEMERRYLLEIPVLLFGEVELARHRLDVDALASRLRDLGLCP